MDGSFSKKSPAAGIESASQILETYIPPPASMVPPVGIEPTFWVPETHVLSIKLWRQMAGSRLWRKLQGSSTQKQTSVYLEARLADYSPYSAKEDNGTSLFNFS